MILDKTSIYELPFHDSKLLEINFKFLENGYVDLIISIMFDYTELDSKLLNIFDGRNKATLIFKDCIWSNINMFGNRDSQELLDYIDIVTNSKKIIEQNLDNEIFSHFSIVFISGSTLSCITKDLYLTS